MVLRLESEENRPASRERGAMLAPRLWCSSSSALHFAPGKIGPMPVETEARERDSPTLAFDEFWRWLILHPNCIVRAGTADCVLYDDDDLHWHFASEAAEIYLCQLIRGKR